MLRLTDAIRNRRAPRHEAEREVSTTKRVDRERARDVARLYTSRIWL